MISLTQPAADKLHGLLKERDDAGVRVGIEGGGCSGFQYKLDFARSPVETDRIIESLGISLFVDPKSYLYLMGTEITYIDSLAGSGFKFVNPNARRTCGCGESFSI